MLKNTFKKFFKKEEKPSSNVTFRQNFAYLKKTIATRENISSVAISSAYALGLKIASSIDCG